MGNKPRKNNSIACITHSVSHCTVKTVKDQVVAFGWGVFATRHICRLSSFRLPFNCYLLIETWENCGEICNTPLIWSTVSKCFRHGFSVGSNKTKIVLLIKKKQWFLPLKTGRNNPFTPQWIIPDFYLIMFWLLNYISCVMNDIYIIILLYILIQLSTN